MSNESPQYISCATLNVKFDGDRDKPVPIPASGAVPPERTHPWQDVYREHPWAERRSRLVDALLSTGPLDIAGFQEVYHNQLLDLSALLGPTYGYVGVGRDDGKEAGEYSPIFYNKEKFELARWKTIWLSPEPDVPGSKGWDANLTRIATICTLSWISGPQAGQLVHAINTHYDDQGVKARAESSLIIRDHIARWVERFEDPNDPTHAPPAPVFLLGDFNSPPEEDGYKNITSTAPLPSGAPSLTFLDSYTNLSTRQTSSSDGNATSTSGPLQSMPYGPNKTYSGFTRQGRTPTTRIDLVMLASARDPKDLLEGVNEEDSKKGRGGWSAERYACVDNWVEEGDVTGWQGRWSDHRIVRATYRRG